MGETLPRSEYRPRPAASGNTQDLGHRFSQYGPPSHGIIGIQTDGKVSPNTDRPRPVNNIFIFFLLRIKSFRKSFLVSNLCVEVGRVHVDEARDRLQTKTLQHDF